MTGREHAARAPLYGAALSAAGLLSCGAAALITVTWVAASLYVAAAIAAGIGVVVTMRSS
ncbi:hypothetical protein [Mycobacterium sp. NAZ190054]|uniref:hypothetical protein n=1 Tax=Mycobacterium sp. NAZ190054 TaxID=1747766 RepID=UPI00079721DB|nr:hypothetical protein [Mycobacterium sp. NAZ190054]KWX66871.1 hypothetical protein ASJ79_23880 [Mycobacterium sp. NAZ190054]